MTEDNVQGQGQVSTCKDVQSHLLLGKCTRKFRSVSFRMPKLRINGNTKCCQIPKETGHLHFANENHSLSRKEHSSILHLFVGVKLKSSQYLSMDVWLSKL